ncbi:unnamed protein product [Lathyrus sativus]|nr:unnamed protein product [Lathyrus sativus]
MVERWKKGVLVGKKGGTCTTPSPTWRFEPPSQQNNAVSTSTVSARKLCANLWQIQHGGTTPRHRRKNNSSDQTAAQLLNVLNRIWSLEENEALNISAVKALKSELDRSRTRMKELVQEKQMNAREMEKLMKKTTMEKLVRKNKERDRIKAAVQSIHEELEDERTLRKHADSLRRKLAREVSEVKSSFSGCLRNLERERKARILLENMCGEFAKGIKSYEQEVRCLRRDSEYVEVKENGLDRLVLHISEAWLDERAQMKLAQSGSDVVERFSIVDKLGFDIEAFLHAKRCVDFRKCGYSSPEKLKEIHPMDLFPPQDAASGPQNMDQENSIGSDWFEPKEIITVEGLRKLGSGPRRDDASELHRENKGRKSSIRKEVMSKKITERSMSRNDNNTSCLVKKKSSEIKEDNIKLWKSKLIASSDFGKTESSTKLPKGVKENTLMAKLLEARLERQRIKSKGGKSTS